MSETDASLAILVEGKTDKDFIMLLLDFLALDKNKIRFFILGNKSNFFKEDNVNYEELANDVDLEQVTQSLFVLDADSPASDVKYGGYQNTQIMLEKTLKNLKLGVYESCIICNPKTKTGYLESLILSTIEGEHKICIDDFLNCSEFKGKQNQKAILHQIYKIAYPNTPYDLQHPNFNPLKTKLTQLFQSVA